MTVILISSNPTENGDFKEVRPVVLSINHSFIYLKQIQWFVFKT